MFQSLKAIISVKVVLNERKIMIYMIYATSSYTSLYEKIYTHLNNSIS